MALREVNRYSQQWPTADMAKIRGEICESGQQKPLTVITSPFYREETKIHGDYLTCSRSQGGSVVESGPKHGPSDLKAMAPTIGGNDGCTTLFPV